MPASFNQWQASIFLTLREGHIAVVYGGSLVTLLVLVRALREECKPLRFSGMEWARTFIQTAHIQNSRAFSFRLAFLLKSTHLLPD